MLSTMQDVPLTISSILRHGTTQYGDAEVVTCTGPGGAGRRASYGEVGERVARLAHALRSLGVTGDERVGTFMWNNQEHLEAYLAVPAMGAVLHTLNIRLFADQIAYIANHAEDSVVIADSSLVPLLAPLLPQMRTVRTVLVVGDADLAVLAESGKDVVRYDEALSGQPSEFAWPDVDERSAAAICYTSGTTGNPKGVAYSHRSSYLHSMGVCTMNTLALSADDRVLPVVPMFHANAWGLPYAALMAGSDLLMPDRFLQAETLVDFIERERPTVSGAVPTIWNDVLTHLRATPGRDISSIKRVICGGSAVPRALMEAFQHEFGVTILQAWGMTETSPLGAVARPPRGSADEVAWSYRCTAGRLAFGVVGRLVDDEGVVLPSDGKAVGELEVRGPWVTGSYLGGEDPQRFHEGWLRTGDVGSLDPRGFFSISDRSKDVIKSGGEWISSVELETTLMGHPDVREACVVGVSDERWQERPLAAVVLTDGAEPDAAGLRGWLADRVARWWLPERWTFIEAVPRTSVGKFDKKVLRQQYNDGLLSVEQLEPMARS